MRTLIETPKSSLNVYNINTIFENHDDDDDKNDNSIIEKCVEEVQDKLLKNPEVFVFGKRGVQHREIGFFSDESIGYRYSNQLARSQPLTPYLKKLLKLINKKFKTRFNGILVNKYANGLDNIGEHSDDESQLDNAGVIAISYGAVRKFRIRDKKTKKIVKDIPTLPNQIIQMKGNFQKEFKHGIPVEKKVEEARISFTFRKHIV
jgi:alkylated DNA repair dioxygenase AlkB